MDEKLLKSLPGYGSPDWCLARAIYQAQNPDDPEAWRKLGEAEHRRMNDEALAIIAMLRSRYSVQLSRIIADVANEKQKREPVNKVVVVRKTGAEPTGKIFNNNGTLYVPEQMLEFIDPPKPSPSEDRLYDSMRGIAMHQFDRHAPVADELPPNAKRV